jgi:ribosomal protein L31E
MVEEKIMVVNLSKALQKPKTKRGNCALRLLKRIVARHAKTVVGLVRISPNVSEAVWNGRYHQPLKTIKVKIVPEDSLVKIMLPDEKKLVKEEKKVEKPVEKKVEAIPEKHVGGERKAPGEKEEKTEEDKQKEKERRDLNKMKKG